MNFIKKVLIVLLISMPSAMAEPANEDSIRHLLSLTGQQKRIIVAQQAVYEQLMTIYSLQEANGIYSSPRRQQMLDNMKKKMLGLIQAAISWDKVEPLIVQRYQKSFSQEEINAQVAFYESPAGQALLNKAHELELGLREDIKFMTVGSGFPEKFKQIQQDFAVEIAASYQSGNK